MNGKKPRNRIDRGKGGKEKMKAEKKVNLPDISYFIFFLFGGRDIYTSLFYIKGPFWGGRGGIFFFLFI